MFKPNRKLTIPEQNIEFANYDDFLNKAKEKASLDLLDIVEKQKILYVNSIRIILNSNKTIFQQLNSINDLRVRYQRDIFNILDTYLEVVCLFGLKQSCKELKIKYPDKLSPIMNAWVKATSDTAAMRFLEDLNLLITIPIVDNITSHVSIKENIYIIELTFDNIIKDKIKGIINYNEGKALYRGRLLGLEYFNGDVKLEADFAKSLSDILEEEKVVAAQWSAILDIHTCELCASLDGKIIDINDPDFTRFHPGELHSSCRCVWVYIKNTERPENRIVDWKSPIKNLIKKFTLQPIAEIVSSKAKNIKKK